MRALILPYVFRIIAPLHFIIVIFLTESMSEIIEKSCEIWASKTQTDFM